MLDVTLRSTYSMGKLESQQLGGKPRKMSTDSIE